MDAAPLRLWVLHALLTVAACNQTQVDPPSEERGGNGSRDFGLLIVGAVGGVLVLCIILLCLAKVLFKRQKPAGGSDLEMGLHHNEQRKIAELKVDHPEFTAVEIEYLLGKHNWDKEEVAARILTGSLVPITARRGRGNGSEHSGSSTSTLRGRIMAELQHKNQEFGGDELLYLLKVHNWDAAAVQIRINNGSVISAAQAGRGVEGSRSSNSRSYRSPRSRGSSSSPRFPSSGSGSFTLPPLSPSIGSSFAKGVRELPRTPTQHRIRPPSRV